MPSLAIHLLGHGWTAINLLDQEQPTLHRDNCSFIWEHDDKSNRSLLHAPAFGNMMTRATGRYCMHQLGHFQSVCVWSNHGYGSVDIS